MSLECASITWKANQVAAMIRKTMRITFESIYQRPYEWKVDRQTEFLDSLLTGFKIPTVVAKRYDDGSGKRNSNVYSILDGQQRLRTIEKIINDEVVFGKFNPITITNDEGEEETFDVSGKKFSELPDNFKNKVFNASISVDYYDNLTQEEERKLFTKLNNGLKVSETSMAVAYAKAIDLLSSLKNARMFGECLTDGKKEKKAYVQLGMKVWMMLNMDIMDIAFGKSLSETIKTTEISKEEYEEIVKVTDFLSDVHTELLLQKKKNVANKLYTEMHLVSMIPFFKQAMSEGLGVEEMVEFVLEFFDTPVIEKVNETNGKKKKTAATSNSSAYNEFSSNGVATNTSIVGRHMAIKVAFEQLFSDADEEEEIEEEQTSFTDEIMNDLEKSETVA